VNSRDITERQDADGNQCRGRGLAQKEADGRNQ
jgi:hypothetical protein